jgi:hypothetical protein
LLRLCPNLHDVRAWNGRRTRRDVEVAIRSDAPRQTLDVITALTGDRDNALDAVRRLGTEIASYLDVSDRAALAADETCRVSIVSSIEDFMIPVEWAVLPNMSSPLSRECPVSRRVFHTGPLRESIEDLFEDDSAAPLASCCLDMGLQNCRTCTLKLPQFAMVHPPFR